MSATEAKYNQRQGLWRKRRREVSHSPPPNPEEGLLALENPTVGNTTKGKDIIPDDRVISYIKKIGANIKGSSSKKTESLTLVLSTSESEYFRSEEVPLLQYMKENLEVDDISLSKPTLGNLDQFMTIYGNSIAVAMASVFVAFILNAKLNNLLSKESYTLKSPNYQLRFLFPCNEKNKSKEGELENIAEYYSLRDFDTTLPYRYFYTDMDLIRIRGDFNSVLHFFVVALDRNTTALERDRIQPQVEQPMYIDVIDKAKLYGPQKINDDILEKSYRDNLAYIYSSSSLKNEEGRDENIDQELL